MIIKIELPDDTLVAFINYVVAEGNNVALVSKGISSKNLKAGYQDCREYTVSEE